MALVADTGPVSTARALMLSPVTVYAGLRHS